MASGFTTAKSSKGSGFTKKKSIPSAGLDLQTIAEKVNKGEEAKKILNPKPKLSILQRLGAGLGAFETGNAVYQGIKNKSIKTGLKQYAKDVGQGLSSAISGKDNGQSEKKHYSDVIAIPAKQNTFADKAIQKTGGLFGDIFLDPSTYLGGRVAEGASKGLGFASKKVTPLLPKAAQTGIENFKSGLGKAFKFGYGTSKGLPEKTLETVGQISKAKEAIVKSNMERLGTGVLSKGQQEELVSKLLAGKRAEFAGSTPKEALDAAKSSDPLVQKTIESQIPRSQKFAKAANIEDPYTVYFPGIAKDKIQKLVENPSFLKVSKEGYKKEFKDLLKDEELIRNPAEAFARTEFNIAKDNIVRSQLNGMVKQFGKPLDAFKTEEEALKAGYQAIKEKGQFGKVIGYLKQEDKKFIDNLISPEFTTIDRLAKATGFDAVTSLFKRSVTGLFAPFHVRNYVSGLIQNYEVLGAKALSPKNLALGQRAALYIAKDKKFGQETIKLGSKEYKLDKILEPFKKRFETSSQYISDFADATSDKLITGKLAKVNPFSQEFVPFKYARVIGNYIETQQKAVAYITALRDGKSVKEALELATQSGFDYRALTPFESKILRRIIPFYSFTRKNIGLQLGTLSKNPQRVSNIIKTARGLEGGFSSEEKAQLPDYAKEQFSTKTGTSASGLPEVAVGFGTPTEAFAQLFSKNPIRRIAAMLNPVFKLPLERAFNKDFFRDRPLNEVIEAGEYARAPQYVKDFLQVQAVEKKDKNGKVRTVYNANPYRLQLLRNLPTARGATYISAIYDGEATTKSRLLNLFTGVKPRPIDLETVEYFRNKDRQAELENLLMQAGVLKKFEKTYEPKN